MVLNNGLGRPKFVNSFKSMFDYFHSHVLPEKHKLMNFIEDANKKRKELKTAEGRVNVQQQKVNRAYEWLEYFKK